MVNVAYTKAIGKTDTLHYVITTWGTPAILVAKTNLTTTLNITWDKMLSQTPAGAIKFLPDNPMYVYTLVLNRVCTSKI